MQNTMQLLCLKIFDMFIKLLKPLCSTSRAIYRKSDHCYLILSNAMHSLPFYILLTLNVRIGNLRINAISFPHLLCGAISSLNISLPKMASIQSLPIQLARYTKMLFTLCNDRISFFKSNLFITL